MTGFSNPIIGGGGSLVYPSIHSPNFETGVQGWSIDKNGDAEFNNIIIRGTFYGTDLILATTGLFLYSGTPALGNLAVSLAPASTTTDPEGNAVQGGLKIYGASGQAILLGLLGSVSELQFQTGSGFEATAANIAAGVAGSGASAIMELILSGPKGNKAGAEDWMQMVFASRNQGGTSSPNIEIGYVPNSGGTVLLLSASDTGITLSDATVNGVPLASTTAPTPGSSGFGGGVWTASQQSALLTLQSIINSVITAGANCGLW